MTSLAGHLLIASPQLEDPNFARAVVLLIHHNPEGAFGVVLNRPSDNTVKELWKEVAQTPCESLRHVHLGGPVSGPLIALHTDSELAEMEILPGLFFAAQRENLERLIAQPEATYRLFVGHSGWGERQLERELEAGSWLTIPATVELVFYSEGDLWKRTAQQVGEAMLIETLKLKELPPDASLN
jgi:putative transcriptional regulator